MTKNEAIAEVILKLAPHLAITLKKDIENPIPEITEIINQIDDDNPRILDNFDLD